jgi:hypothetical protein
VNKVTNGQPGGTTTTDASLEIIQRWVRERLAWEQFLAAAADQSPVEAKAA